MDWLASRERFVVQNIMRPESSTMGVIEVVWKAKQGRAVAEAVHAVRDDLHSLAVTCLEDFLA